MPGDDIDALFFYEQRSADHLVPVLSSEDVSRAFNVADAALLGRGSFGETWHLVGSVSTAAKVILNESYPADRLAREVEGLRRTTSPNVVRLIETRTVDLSIGRRAALLCEFIAGGDVAIALTAGRPSYEEAHAFGVGVLSGVAAMHQTDTVHRDLKPENIVLRDGDWSQPVLLDLGLAKVLDQGTLTTYPTLLGTLPFMAPEQIRMEQARKAADLWAVGVVLHLVLTGRHPFYGTSADAATRSQALSRIAAGAPELPADVPEPLRTVATRLLKQTPNERGSAARALRNLVSGLPVEGIDD